MQRCYRQIRFMKLKLTINKRLVAIGCALFFAFVIALLPAVVWGCYVFRSAQPDEANWFHGLPMYPFFIVLLAVGTAVGTEAAIQRWRGKRITIRDGSAVVRSPRSRGR